MASEYPIPPDEKQCQSESREYNPWRLGGRVYGEFKRCENRATVIATACDPKDGGSMSLCEDCRSVFVENQGDDFARFRPVAGTVEGET